MTEARVNLAARLDGVGTIVRQKQTLDRVSAVLCDGIGDKPSGWWRHMALFCVTDEVLVGRCNAIADLIESENL